MATSGAHPNAAELTAGERANIKLIDDMLGAWATLQLPDAIPILFTADTVFKPSPGAMPVSGHQGMLEHFKRITGGGNKVEFWVIESFAKGAVVAHHRRTTFITPQQTRTSNAAAVFYFKEGKIAEWSDYPDQS
jgi:limonene-1,2-epoxide hydrolase